MTTPTITDKNRVLAEFVELKAINCVLYIEGKNPLSTLVSYIHLDEYLKKGYVAQLNFDESLDWLWPVWCKLRKLTIPEEYYEEIVWAFEHGVIAEIHEALYNAIVWYNENK